MKGLDSLVKNPLVKRAFEKQLGKIFKDHNLKIVTITISDAGDFVIEAYTEEKVIIDKSQFAEMTTKLLNL